MVELKLSIVFPNECNTAKKYFGINDIMENTFGNLFLNMIWMHLFTIEDMHDSCFTLYLFFKYF